MNQTKKPTTSNQFDGCGIIYVATSEKYINEAIQSATSCKQHNPYPIALITDSNAYQLPKDLFDIVLVEGAFFSYRDKLLIRHSPFEKTIFLDTDTMVIGGLSDLFRLLDFREFGIFQQDEGYEFPMPELSAAMPEFNTGVIAFRMTDSVRTLFHDWNSSFDAVKEIVTDQYHLRKTLYESDVKFATFSSAYNFIVSYNNYVIQNVKVLHGRPFSYLQAVAKKINLIPHEDAWRRAYYPFNNRFFMLYYNLTLKDSITVYRYTTRIFLSNLYRSLEKSSRKIMRRSVSR